MTRVLCIIPLITRLLAKTNKITSHGVSFYNLFVTIHISQQRNSLPKTLTSLSNRICWVSDMKEISTFLDSGHYRLSNGQKRNDRQKLGRPMQIKGTFSSIEKSRVIKYDIQGKNLPQARKIHREREIYTDRRLCSIE